MAAFRSLAALALLASLPLLAAGAQGPEPTGRARVAVTTAFPHGATKNGAVEVLYDAEPGGAAEITRVAYSINGGPWEYVYLKGGDGASPKGTLGAARVMLAPGENNIVFMATDSTGGTATCTVPETPVFDFGSTPDRSGASLAQSAAGANAQYVTDQIVVIARNGATDAQVARAARTVNGAIAAQVNPVGMYWLRLPGKHTEAQLKTLCGRLLADHSDVFAAASLDTLRTMDVPAPGALGGAWPLAVNPTDDPWWGYGEWGLTAMNVPDVWAAYGTKLYDTKAGVVDNGFRATHEDLQLQESNVYNRNIADKNHGSHVMGTIGAVHNNAKGLAGIMDAQRASLYGYDCFALWNGAYDSDIIAGLAWTVSNGAKAVNFSLGADGGASYSTWQDTIYSNAMRNLLNQGYDYVVVHAAGNDAINANRAALFAFVTPPELRQRILTVGAADRYDQLAYFTNWGPLVDVVAPGVDIYSSVAASNSSYAYYSGTSMAAPHITALAGLVYSADPGLSGDAVKTFIVDAAHESGVAITDTRYNVPVAERRTYHLANAKAALDKAIAGAIVRVFVSPKALTLTTGYTHTFTVTVFAPAGNTAVAWTASDGTITQDGTYTAPETAGTYTVTATSQEDPSQSSAATVTVVYPVSVSVQPKVVALTAGGIQTFAVSVAGGAGNTAVRWMASGGSITQGGVYTAPATPGTYAVAAISQEDPYKSDTASIMVGLLTIVGPPRGLFAGGSAKFSASVEGLFSGTVIWSATGGAITPDGAYTAPAELGTYTITAASAHAPEINDSVQVKVSDGDFDGNAEADPQLLGLADAFGSAAGPDLDKYDFDGSGTVDDGDLDTLFAGMGW
jgi:subtilisin family serine protease